MIKIQQGIKEDERDEIIIQSRHFSFSPVFNQIQNVLLSMALLPFSTAKLGASSAATLTKQGQHPQKPTQTSQNTPSKQNSFSLSCSLSHGGQEQQHQEED